MAGSENEQRKCVFLKLHKSKQPFRSALAGELARPSAHFSADSFSRRRFPWFSSMSSCTAEQTT